MINKGSAIPTVDDVYELVNNGIRYETNFDNCPREIYQIRDTVLDQFVMGYWRGYNGQGYAAGQLLIHSDDNSSTSSVVLHDETYDVDFVGIPTGRSILFPFLFAYDDSTWRLYNNKGG